MVTRYDVVAAYRAILGREPESEEAIGSHLAHASAADLIASIAGSHEAQACGRRGRERRLNMFVYEECALREVGMPGMPVYLSEQYGQCGEDLIIASLLTAWSRRTGRDLATATYLEIGGNHPVASSATYLLHRLHGMTGVIVEANPELVPALRAVRSGDRVVFGAVQTADVESVRLSVANQSEVSSLDRSFVAQWAGGRIGERALVEVPALRIDAVIESHLGGAAPQFLSIDIEGLDLPVLRDLDFRRYRPVVVQAEPSDQFLPGNSGQMIDYMRGVGYLLVASTPVNLVFIDAEAI